MQMRRTVEIETFSIVFVGMLNPAIFSPHWMASNGLMDQAAADDAKVEVIHRDLASFETNAFALQVDLDRFVLRAKAPAPITTFDLALQIFTDLLPHTPLRAAGLNYSVHFRVADGKALDAVGDALAPKEPWGDWAKVLNAENKQEKFVGRRRGGLRTLIMEQTARDDGKPGYIQAKVAPSQLVLPGIFVEVNDHYAVEEKNIKGSTTLLSLIRGEYDISVQRSRHIVDQLIALTEKYER
jgi:hypothetical protein